jgi:hypothetical protein
MLAFRKKANPKPDEDAWGAVAFSEGRAVWRDSLALLIDSPEVENPPRTTEWLSQLVEVGALDASRMLTADCYGLMYDPRIVAKPVMWRTETLRFPATYLGNQLLIGELRRALDVAEQTGRRLTLACDTLSTRILIPNWDGLAPKDQKKARAQKKDDIWNLSRAVGAPRIYWAAIDPHFRQVMLSLPHDVQPDEYGVLHYGVQSALPSWAAQVRVAAQSAFRSATSGLVNSGRGLRAVAAAEDSFERQLNHLVAPYLTPQEAADVAST